MPWQPPPMCSSTPSWLQADIILTCTQIVVEYRYTFLMGYPWLPRCGVCLLFHAASLRVVASMLRCPDTSSIRFPAPFVDSWPRRLPNVYPACHLATWWTMKCICVITIYRCLTVLLFPESALLFFLCKDSASHALQGHVSNIDSKIFSDNWGAVALLPIFQALKDENIFGHLLHLRTTTCQLHIAA